MSLILLIILVVVVVASLPTWPCRSGWSYCPSGSAGLALPGPILPLLTRRLHHAG